MYGIIYENSLYSKPVLCFTSSLGTTVAVRIEILIDYLMNKKLHYESF